MAMISIVEQLFRYENLAYEIVDDPLVIMRYTKGKVRPSTKALRPRGEDVLLFNIYEAVEWINEKGLRHLC